MCFKPQRRIAYDSFFYGKWVYRRLCQLFNGQTLHLYHRSTRRYRSRFDPKNRYFLGIWAHALRRSPRTINCRALFCAFGRHILAERVTDLLSFAGIIGQFANRNGTIPTKIISKPLLYILSPFIGMNYKFIKNNVGKKLNLNTDKSSTQLQMAYTPLEKNVKDMIDVYKVREQD